MAGGEGIGGRVGQYAADVGAVLEVHARTARVSLRRYQGRSVAHVRAFAAEQLKLELTSQQLDIVRLYCGHRFVAVRSAVGLGKTWAAAVIVLYHLYIERGQVVTLGASDRQVRELLWGAIRQLWSRATLPGEMFQQSLRVDEATGQVAVGFVTSDPAKLRGWHHPRLLVVIDEAQGVPGWAFDGVLALATGEANRVLAIGNPGPPSGPWYAIHQNPAWARLVLSAIDHVNIREDREVVPGGPSRAWLERVGAEYGENSGYFRGLVLGEFAEELGEGLFERAWIDAAVARWQDGSLEPAAAGQPFVAALDVARYGPDSNALLLSQGGIVRHVATWRRCDLVETVDRAVHTLAGWGVAIFPPDRVNAMRGFPSEDPLVQRYGALPPATLIIDSIGVGAGVYDVCRQRRFTVREFVASGAASPSESHKFLNRRAEAAFNVMRRFQDGTIAMPPHERLIEELLAVRWFQNPAGKIQLEGKDEMRLLLGRSPDVMDALVMAVEPDRGVTYRRVSVRYA